MRRLGSSILISVLLLINFPAVASSSYGAGDLTQAAVFALGRCESQTSLDCIESLELRNSDGSWTRFQFDGYGPATTLGDNSGNTITTGYTNWSIGEKNVNVIADLESPEHIILNDNGTPTLRGAALRISINTEDPLNTYLRVRLRTSWLKPQSVQLKVKESQFSVVPISGGKLWTLEGSGLRYSDYTSNLSDPKKADFSAQAEVDNTFFTFFLHHADARPGYGYWPATCADKGFTVQSNNTNTTGEPRWNNVTKSLEFGIYAPHLKANGEVNLGYFMLWTTTDFLDCKFPRNNLTNAASIEIRVVDETGESQIATTTVSNKNGVINVFAYGFHFSKPKIILTAKKITLSCKRGATVKKVSGTNPRCPKGYVKG